MSEKGLQQYYERRYAGHQVYIAQLPNGHVKIGHSGNPSVRVYQLRTRHPGVCLLHTIASNVSVFVEHLFHQRFAEHHIANEWFAIPAGELDVLRTIRRIDLKTATIAAMDASGIGACICRPLRTPLEGPDAHAW
jgi:hypothetical protein